MSIKINEDSICKSLNYSNNYSLVTTVYKRNNLLSQIKYISQQSHPPKHIIIVHDRNIVNVTFNRDDIIYVHTINFPAGFYFRYLISLLSPENDVIIYDDDWFPYNKTSHSIWIKKTIYSGEGIYGHHCGSKNGLRWCATPLLIHRKWLILLWYNSIYRIDAGEDGHISFSLYLFCKIKCIKEAIVGLVYKKDNLSSSKSPSKTFWERYTNYEKKKIGSYYINNIKKMYNIY